jgi:hypothetical protein
MVRFSPRAARALGWLKRPYNDVEIFVEDTGNHNMWLHICRNLLPQGTRLSSVNMLGGRDAVLEACRLDQAVDARRKIYIMDGDFDFLLGRPKPRLRFLYRVQAYCVENLLLNERSLIAIGLESKPTLNEAAIAATIGYKQIVKEIDNTLRPLFVNYATAFSEARRVRTVRLPVQTLYEMGSGGPTLSLEKIRRRSVSVLLQAARYTDVALLRKKRSEIAARASSLPLAKVVSGKDYHLPFALARFKACCGYGLGAEQFKVALSRSFEAIDEPYLARRLAKL